MKYFVDLVGNIYGRLVVIEKHPIRSSKNKIQWKCLCSPDYGGCGNIAIIVGKSLKRGEVKSCGCLKIKNVDKTLLEVKEVKISRAIGLSHTTEYSIWSTMLGRCYNEKTKSYPEYGGRGITVCDEWKDSFETFYKDMGLRPSLNHTLDRKDNYKGYSKDNCRWATWEEQANNRSNNIFYTHNGVSRTLAGWCRELNLNYKLAYSQKARGWSFEQIINFKDVG